MASNPEALGQAAFLLLNNLLKYLYISGKFQDGELSALIDGTIKAAENSEMQGAADALKTLKGRLGSEAL